jgi:hypothetical protein
MDRLSPTPPALVLWRNDGCGLCRKTRGLLDSILAERAAAGLPVPTIVERDIHDDPAAERAWFELIPVLELGERRLELALHPAPIRAFLAGALDEDAPAASG